MLIGARRALSAAGVVLLGDSLAHAIYPKGHLEVWTLPRGPLLYRRAMERIRARSGLLALVSAVELAAGVALLALSQRPGARAAR